MNTSSFHRTALFVLAGMAPFIAGCGGTYTTYRCELRLFDQVGVDRVESEIDKEKIALSTSYQQESMETNSGTNGFNCFYLRTLTKDEHKIEFDFQESSISIDGNPQPFTEFTLFVRGQDQDWPHGLHMMLGAKDRRIVPAGQGKLNLVYFVDGERRHRTVYYQMKNERVYDRPGIAPPGK